MKLRNALFASSLALASALPFAAMAEVSLPIVLTDTEVVPRANPADGMIVIGSLADGTRIEVEIREDGTLDEIEAQGRGLFPLDQVATAVSNTITESPDWPAGALLEKIEFERDGSIEIEGILDGKEFEAAFAADGTRTEWDIDG